MRALLVAAVLGLAVGLSSCSVFTPPKSIGVSQDLPAPLRAAQATINDVNILITAASTVIGQNLKDKIYTKAEAQTYLNRVKDLRDKVVKAQEMVMLGDLTAEAEANLIQRAIVALHREVVARARKE